MGYQMEKPEGKVARAYGNELRTSWKNAINITRQIQGMDARKAELYLEDVIALRRPVKFTTRNRKVAAKPGIGKGRYPKKSAKATLAVLRNAINNAEYQGHDADNMFIHHASAYKGRTLKAFMPRAHGRATAKNEETCNVEIILRERAEAPEGKSKAKKAEPAKDTEAAKKAAPEKPEPKPEPAKEPEAARKTAEKKPDAKAAEHEHKPGEKHDHAEKPKKTPEAKS